MKTNLILYIHGKGGSHTESEHYSPLFPEADVIGLDYKTFTPWETGKEIHDAVVGFKARYKKIILIANSIGAFFSMNAELDGLVEKAFFISPVTDMEKLISDMMKWANVNEAELKEKKVIPTSFGEDLSWDYLTYVRNHPLSWNIPTRILYGRNDQLISFETISTFAKKHGAPLTVMENGEHWFHTAEQQKFLDEWIEGNLN
ncbi:MAG: alpha/beta hydrolase [Treponema sp.]|nr:alpha/beta hydrolase [Treponema sp.]